MKTSRQVQEDLKSRRENNGRTAKARSRRCVIQRLSLSTRVVTKCRHTTKTEQSSPQSKSTLGYKARQITFSPTSTPSSSSTSRCRNSKKKRLHTRARLAELHHCRYLTDAMSEIASALAGDSDDMFNFGACAEQGNILL